MIQQISPAVHAEGEVLQLGLVERHRLLELSHRRGGLQHRGIFRSRLTTGSRRACYQHLASEYADENRQCMTRGSKMDGKHRSSPQQLVEVDTPNRGCFQQ